jgi:hypothetical protein
MVCALVKMADVSAHTPVAVYCIIGFSFSRRRISALFIWLCSRGKEREKMLIEILDGARRWC